MATPLKFINLTRRVEIGANCYYMEALGQRFVLDCGMHPKNEGDEATPNFHALGGREIDAMIVSHAHLDHIGTLPLLMRRFPGAPVFMSEPTAEIGYALLHNSVNVMTRQREEIGRTMYPLFTHRETEDAAARWQWCPLRQPVTLQGERAQANDRSEVTFEMIDAGHVLGSTGVLLRCGDRTVFYTGDVNFDDQTIMKGAIFPDEGIDVLIVECTRGDNALPETFTRAAEEQRFIEAIESAFDRGGCVLIPVFALGKTQETLVIFHEAQRQRRLRQCPIYIGGLSAKMTEIYDRHASTARRNLPRLHLMEQVEPFVLNGKTIGDAPARPGRIYALSSGMMTPKTLSNIFARRILEDPQHSIFFVGYADPESPAGIIRSAKEGDEIVLDEDEPPLKLRCRIEQFQFSAHASRESLIEYVKRVRPAKIVLVHGDLQAIERMRAEFAALLPDSDVIVPTPGVELEL